MKKLMFDIYIGKGISLRQGEDIVAYVALPSDIPTGQVNVSGGMIDNTIGFSFLHLLKNYMADWLDFLEDENLIKANIHLNKQSQNKVFKGREILRAIDIIASENNRTFTGSLAFIGKEMK